jgi:hypothetical protein
MQRRFRLMQTEIVRMTKHPPSRTYGVAGEWQTAALLDMTRSEN